MEDQQAKFREEIQELTEGEILNRIKIFENNIRIMKSEENQVKHQSKELTLAIADNEKKLQNNKQLPYLVSNIVELLKNDDPQTREDHEHHTTAIIKTSTR